ncbi:MAG: hypothetical protein DMG27_23650 [Acidobacteria bacterium]|nr:MAG: hypothetical protein DMG27_23650 [Acidobacteriota bacterium]
MPADLSAGPMEWPAPRRLETSPNIVDFGYEDAVMLIAPMHADTSVIAERSARLGAEVTVLVCREICLSSKAQLSLILPIKLRQPEPHARTSALFDATRKSLPRPARRDWRRMFS